MLLKLSARGLNALTETSERAFVGRLHDVEKGTLPDSEADVLLARTPTELPEGFRAYLLRGILSATARRDAYLLHSDFDYLAHGDIVRIDPMRGRLTTLYRRASRSNSFLVTERCDNYCVMCSQPPRETDDRWLVEELVRDVIPLVAKDTADIGITGGEPALLGESLVRLLDTMKQHLPHTAVHVLSNGRRFSDVAFARAIGNVRHSDVMFGIPLYSDLPEEHDYVVQRRGAFDETVRGILNLKRQGVRVEIRFVVHRETYQRLPMFARFVARNLLFVDHVALMGLELVGFGKTNADALWIDPIDYQAELATATKTLAQAGARVSVYNHALCVLPEEVRPYARKSISDWKNKYLDECVRCCRRDECGGFFASGVVRPSAGVRAFS